MNRRVAMVIVAVVAVLAIAIYRGATAQPASAGAVKIYPDGQVKFDWRWVESCARQGDPMCRVAMAARKEGCQ